ncbi:unnamed protein product, partial [Choristocarpus tenellus]
MRTARPSRGWDRFRQQRSRHCCGGGRVAAFMAGAIAMMLLWSQLHLYIHQPSVDTVDIYKDLSLRNGDASMKKELQDRIQVLEAQVAEVNAALSSWQSQQRGEQGEAARQEVGTGKEGTGADVREERG